VKERGSKRRREGEREESEGEREREILPKMSSGRKKGAASGSSKDMEADGKKQAKLGVKQSVAAAAGAGGASKGGSVLVLPTIEAAKPEGCRG
jgi:hypothetical protein